MEKVRLTRAGYTFFENRFSTKEIEQPIEYSRIIRVEKEKHSNCYSIFFYNERDKRCRTDIFYEKQDQQEILEILFEKLPDMEAIHGRRSIWRAAAPWLILYAILVVVTAGVMLFSKPNGIETPLVMMPAAFSLAELLRSFRFEHFINLIFRSSLFVAAVSGISYLRSDMMIYQNEK